MRIKDEHGFTDILIGLFPWICIIGFWLFIMRRMNGGAGGGNGVFSVGKSKAKIYEKGGEIGVTFKDVAGQEGCKTRSTRDCRLFKESTKIYRVRW